jgi:uncharacterized protein
MNAPLPVSNIIDMHTHIYDDATLEDYLKKADGRVKRVLTYAYFEQQQNLQDNEHALAFAARHPDFVSVVAAVDMNGDIAAQLEHLRKLFEEKKIVGIKLYPGYQDFTPSDERVDPIAELCGEFNRPVIFHSGITNADAKGTRIKNTRPAEVDDIAVRHPNTNFIICHYGFPDFMDTSFVLSDNDNVYSEISATIYGTTEEDLENMKNQTVADIKRTFNYFSNSPDIREKIMFGTDFQNGGGDVGGESYNNIVEPYIVGVQELFDPKFHDNVFHSLAEKLFFS